MSNKVLLKLISIGFFTLIFSACGGGGSSSQIQQTTLSQFIDSAVEGVRYSTATQSGTTDANGSFSYLTGEVVSFFIGDILLGTATGSSQITPLDFVPGAVDATNPTVSNILRFVQSLDSDNNPDNGITISSLVATQASGQSLDFTLPLFELAAMPVLNMLTSGSVVTLVTADAAQAHFNASIAGGPGSGSVSDGLTLAGADTGVIGTSFVPESNVVNNGDFSVTWASDNFGGVTNAGAAFSVSDIFDDGDLLADLLIFVVTFPDTPNESHIYKLKCFENRSACDGVIVDMANKKITLGNTTLPVDDVSFTTNVATAAVVVSGELNWD